ncbi:MAG: NAD(P)/FAD-dependent oxidoreductase [Saprospiraceae bacterium]
MTHPHHDVLIIGAGLSGISAAYYLQADCPGKTYAILEGRATLGGTWDLFRYPGIRSDSDMYTLGFRFEPWTGGKAIADGKDIMTYLQQTVRTYGIDEHIVYGQFIDRAEWSTETATWTLTSRPDARGETHVWTCNFISGCTGYYDYDRGYTPDFPGSEDFRGRIIHPQKWPAELDYSGKRIVVIGSGATAITLVPELGKQAAKVTMLQRSPTYIVTQPNKDKIADFLRRILPGKVAYSISRWKNILYSLFTYQLSRKYPRTLKKLLLSGVKKELGDKYEVEHFTPDYNPWDQRLCLVPDSDLFNSIKAGRSTIVTGHIETFTENGILLKSGEELPADIIVTATGLRLKLLGGIAVIVDGRAVSFPDTVAYRSMMFSGVPNFSVAFGYTNASWTLKVDLTNRYVCRLLNYMEANGYRYCVPRQTDPDLRHEPFMDFQSGYVQRSLHMLPKSGHRSPWKLKQNYVYDRYMLERGRVDDGVMGFG